nr:MAG: hypothetical protein DIU78_09730 [Pseudomonadota bacterium]
MVVVLAWMIAPRAARAELADPASRAVARQLGYAGVQAYQEGDFATAYDKFEKAYGVLKVPTLGLWSARSMVELGMFVEASERYREVQRLSVVDGDIEVQRRAQADAAAELRALLPRIPMLTIAVENATSAELALFVDGNAIASALVNEALPINPGRHDVEARRGEERVTAQVVLDPGERERVVLVFAQKAAAPAPSPPTTARPSPALTLPLPETRHAEPEVSSSASRHSTQNTLGWVGLGLGGAALASSGVTAWLAFDLKRTLDDSPACSAGRCGRVEQDRVNEYATLRTVSTVSFYAGAALAAGGAVLLLTTPTAEAHDVALTVGPASVRLQGRF